MLAAMADRLGWGILATGGIARQFASGLRVSQKGRLVATGSRNPERARAFAHEFGGIGYGSYEEVLADPEVDAVYIATPHHLHHPWTIACARAGKGILCEKPFTLNLAEAESALAAVRDAGVFFMEAFMYRCHPQTRWVVDAVRNGAIGELRMINAEFGFQAGRDWDNFRTVAELGGGALMDVGVYPVSFSRLLAGKEPTRLCYCASLERGYDASGSGVMTFEGGVTAHFAAAIHLNLANDARIYGESGHIVVESPWKCYPGAKTTLRRIGKDDEVLSLGSSNDELYALEADAVAEFWSARECPYMTPADTLGNMRTLDRLRESAGLEFGT